MKCDNSWSAPKRNFSGSDAFNLAPMEMRRAPNNRPAATEKGSKPAWGAIGFAANGRRGIARWRKRKRETGWPRNFFGSIVFPVLTLRGQGLGCAQDFRPVAVAAAHRCAGGRLRDCAGEPDRKFRRRSRRGRRGRFSGYHNLSLEPPRTHGTGRRSRRGLREVLLHRLPDAFSGPAAAANHFRRNGADATAAASSPGDPRTSFRSAS